MPAALPVGGTMNKIRVGVIGLGSIFHRVMKGFSNSKYCELTAVAARVGARARTEAGKYGAKHAFGSYEELAKCPEVDMVYIATPHSHHFEHTMLCLEHGKHVICEKAFAKNDAEARLMADKARKKGVFLSGFSAMIGSTSSPWRSTPRKPGSSVRFSSYTMNRA